MKSNAPLLDYARSARAQPFATWGFIAAGCGLAAMGLMRTARVFSSTPLWWFAILFAVAATLAGLLGILHGRSRVYRFGILLSLSGVLLGGSTATWAILLSTCGPTRCGFPPPCRLNLLQIGQAMRIYATEHRGRYPDTLGELMEEEITTDVFVCPYTKDTPAAPSTNPSIAAANVEAPGHLSYIYLAKGLTHTNSPDVVLAYEPLSNHQNTGINILFGDGHVEWFDAKKAARLLAELKAGHNPPRAEGVK